MTEFDHQKLVQRDPREMARFRRWLLGGQARDVEAVDVVLDHDHRCCRREPWHLTAVRIIDALEPTVPQVLALLTEENEHLRGLVQSLAKKLKEHPSLHRDDELGMPAVWTKSQT
jgi:hypothetical protein